MKKIMLVCSAGMSTSLLVNKMKEAAKAEGFDCEIFAHSEKEAKGLVSDVDCILIGPQIRYAKGQFEKITDRPVEVIDMKAYGRVDGAAVLVAAKKLMGL